jgi:hypothetical protein
VLYLETSCINEGGLTWYVQASQHGVVSHVQRGLNRSPACIFLNFDLM